MEPVFPHNPSPSQDDTHAATPPDATDAVPHTPASGKLAKFLNLMDKEMSRPRVEPSKVR